MTDICQGNNGGKRGKEKARETETERGGVEEDSVHKTCQSDAVPDLDRSKDKSPLSDVLA